MGSMNNLEKFLIVLSISIIVIYVVFLGYRVKNIAFVGNLSKKYKIIVSCTILVILVFAIGSIYFVFYETVNKLNSISSVASLLGIFALVNFISSIYTKHNA